MPGGRPRIEIPDLLHGMREFCKLDATTLCIRKTKEDPPRVSVFDLIERITRQTNPHQIYRRICAHYPEVLTKCSNFPFPGQGQKSTPVTDARGAAHIIMHLPGDAAKEFRDAAADMVVRYIGGDQSLSDEIDANHQAQATLPENHPARFFGQTVESEARQPYVHPPPLVLPAPAPFQAPCKGERDLYLLYIPSLDVSRPGRTDDYGRRLQDHRRELARDAYYLLQAPGYGHLEKEVHRLYKAQRVSPRDEKIPGKIDAAKLSELLPQMHQQFLAEAAPSAPPQQPEQEDPEERALKRRRLTVQVRNLELEADERELALEKERWAFEQEKARAG